MKKIISVLSLIAISFCVFMPQSADARSNSSLRWQRYHENRRAEWRDEIHGHISREHNRVESEIRNAEIRGQYNYECERDAIRDEIRREEAAIRAEENRHQNDAENARLHEQYLREMGRI